MVGWLEPLTAEPWLRFQLLQMGELDGQRQRLVLDGGLVGRLGLVAAVGWLEQGAGRPLMEEEQGVVAGWVARVEGVVWEEMVVLTVREEGLRQRLAANRVLRQKGVRPLGPQAWRVPRRAEAAVRGWLGREGWPVLEGVGMGEENDEAYPSTAVAWAWLGVALCRQLGRMMPLPVAIPHEAAEVWERQLTVAERTALGEVVERMGGQVGDLVRGWDAFWPAPGGLDPELVAAVRGAVAEGRPLSIAYQTPAELTPRWRVVEPWRLEERGALLYLVGFCQLAQGERVFRVDRIRELGIGD